MKKEIIPIKLIVDCKLEQTYLMYKLKIDGVSDNRFHTIKVNPEIKEIISQSIKQAEEGETVGLRSFQLQHKVKEVKEIKGER